MNLGKWPFNAKLSSQACLCSIHPVAVDHRHFAGKQNINYFGNPKYYFTSKVLMAQMHFVLWLTCPRYRWNVDLIQCCICQYSHINLLSPEPWLSSPTRIERRQNPHQKHITWSNQQLTMIELTEWEHHGYRYECYTWRNSLQISLHSMNGFPHNISNNVNISKRKNKLFYNLVPSLWWSLIYIPQTCMAPNKKLLILTEFTWYSST